MNVTFRNSLITHGASIVTHIGLVNAVGTELSGGSPAYARRAVAWTAAADGLIRPTADIVYDIPPGGVVAQWRGYSALTAGTDFGGQTLTQETFAGQGTYRLFATSTSIGVT